VLDGINGQVLVNRGRGYRVVKGPMELKPGYSVIANPGGSAVVSYTDGCNVAVAAGSVVAVAAGSPCAADVTHSFHTPGAASDGAQVPAPGGWDGATVGVAALGLGAVIGAAALIAGGSEKRGLGKPASP
jgi:hypothetical protein